MKRSYLLLAGLLLLTIYSSSQQNYQAESITDNAVVDLNNLLPDGKASVDVMDLMKSDPRAEELARRFQESLHKNYEWLIDYMQTYPEGQPMPYHKNTGLTEEEFSYMLNFSKDIELVSSGKTNVTIKRKKNILQFSAKGKLEILKFIKIDLTRNVVMIGEQELPFAGKIDVTNNTNALKSKWKGYTWKFENPENPDANELKDIQNLEMKIYKFSVGQLEKSGRTIVFVKAQELKNGINLINFETQFIL